MNLFDEGHDDGVHMMDMMDLSLENWLPLIISVSIILLVSIALILFFIYFYRSVSVKNKSFQTNRGIQGNNETNVHRHASENYIPEEIFFCYQCGEKIDNRLLKYCANCGAKL